MYRVSKTVHSKHDAALLYQLVNDTEAYQSFLPYCKKSQVLAEQGNEKRCLLMFAKGPFMIQMITKNSLTPGRKIEVCLESGDFEHLHGYWQFLPLKTGTEVSVYFEYTFKNRWLHYTLGRILSPLAQEVVDIFFRRADEQILY